MTDPHPADEDATLDRYLGYVYTSRRETPQEFAKRTGSTATPAVAAGPMRSYRLVTGFAEHDEKFGSAAEVIVSRSTPPTRSEAERLIYPAIWTEVTRALGEGDWRPSMNWLDLIELLEAPPE